MHCLVPDANFMLNSSKNLLTRAAVYQTELLALLAVFSRSWVNCQESPPKPAGCTMSPRRSQDRSDTVPAGLCSMGLWNCPSPSAGSH